MPYQAAFPNGVVNALSRYETIDFTGLSEFFNILPWQTKSTLSFYFSSSMNTFSSEIRLFTGFFNCRKLRLPFTSLPVCRETHPENVL